MAERARVSRGAWVRQAIEERLERESPELPGDPLAALRELNGPTADICAMISEIEAGALVRVFVDSNVPMYVAGADHPNRPPACRPGSPSTRG